MINVSFLQISDGFFSVHIIIIFSVMDARNAAKWGSLKGSVILLLGFGTETLNASLKQISSNSILIISMF